jgi:hypothetical protein
MMTRKDLERLQAEGKIRGFTDQKPTPKPDAKAVDTKRRANKNKEWITLNLKYWAEANRLELKTEFQFDPARKFRFDWAVPEKKLAWEYEGLMSEKNGHTSLKGFTANTEKYNEAAAQGWRVIRYTFKNYRQLITDLNKLL